MAVINTNVAALTAQVNLNMTSTRLGTSIERLSSGLRINRAADDAAGLAISEALVSQIKGTEQAVRNSQDGVSMIQTAEGALNEMQSILQRMNELAVQASSSDLNNLDRTAIQGELNQLTAGLDSISSNTQFNGLNLLTGQMGVTYGAGSVQSFDPNVLIDHVDLTGATPNTTYTFSVCTFNSTATYASPSVTQTVSIRDMLPSDNQILNFDALGIQIHLQTPAIVLFSSSVSATEILTALTGDTFSTATSNGAATIQIGANNQAADRLGLSFVQMDSSALGLVGAVDVSTTITAGQLIAQVRTAINLVSTQRATLGALQNSLGHTINNLNVNDVNLTAANSRIRDLDVAAQTVTFTKDQILMQAGTSVLAQANVMPQSVLTLLR